MRRARGQRLWLPPIPKVVTSPLGDVPVILISPSDVPEENREDVGWWMPRERRIVVVNDGAPQAIWQAFVHEKVHMWLDDAYVNFPLNARGEPEAEERTCEVVSHAIVAEMIANASTRPSRR